MVTRPLTTPLALALTLALMVILWSNMRSAQLSTLAMNQILLSNQGVTEKISASMEALAASQNELVKLQQLVTSFSDKQIQGRRAQASRARTLIGLCAKGDLTGARCANLPDADTLEMLER